MLFGAENKQLIFFRKTICKKEKLKKRNFQFFVKIVKLTEIYKIAGKDDFALDRFGLAPAELLTTHYGSKNNGYGRDLHLQKSSF